MNLFEKLKKAFIKESTISLYDKIVKAYAEGKSMPLDGHTRIIFTDAKTGKERVVADKHNLVTNAVAEILSKNTSGLMSLYSILPLYNSFAGILCFQEEITENANNYIPPTETTNPLVAHAGQSMNSTVSTLRGNPVISDVVKTDTSVKWVWNWDTSHGNGTIRTVCLCPDSLGNMGLKPIDNSLNIFSTMAIDNLNGIGSGVENDKAFMMKFPISIDDNGQTGKAIYWPDNSTTFMEVTVKHDWFKFGIMRDKLTWQEVSNRTATVRSFNSQKATIFEDANYYYLIAVTSATAIQMDKVAKSDFTVTQSDITLSGTSLFNDRVYPYTWSRGVPRFPFDGTYLYIPKSDLTTFYRIPLANPANVEELSGSATIVAPYSDNYGQGIQNPIVFREGLILGASYIINGNNVYSVAAMPAQFHYDSSYSKRTFVDFVKKGATVYGNSHQWITGNAITGQGPAYVGMFLSTINVLDEAVTKDNTVSMRIEYTLTEV